MTTWGVAATIKAAPRDILSFAAHHLDLGAHRLYIYLDDANPSAFAPLKAHPKIRVTTCDAAYWQKTAGYRPKKHQVRQTLNATHAYNRRAEVDWLAHIDVDEFLWPETTVTDTLAALPLEVLTARVRPVESLTPDTPDPFAPATAFKATPVDRAARAQSTAALYPEFAGLIDDGFLSHVAGKIFLRTGLDGVEFRIHNAFRDGTQNPGETELDAISLLHMHAESWADWRARFDYRHEHGAYRAELGRKGPSGLTLHQVFADLIAAEGEAGLRRFHDQLCLASPAHCAALREQGLLRIHDLDLSAKRRQHFPGVDDDDQP